MMDIADWYAEFRPFFATQQAYEEAVVRYPCEIACRIGIAPRAAFEEYQDSIATETEVRP